MCSLKDFLCYEILFLIFPLVITLFAQTGKEKPKYLNPNLSVDERIKDLLNRMTLEEKISQLQCEIIDLEKDNSVIERGIGNLGPALRSYSAEKAAEWSNEIQKIAMEKTRLRVPVLLHDECLHGLVGKESTSFPQAIGLAASWNEDLMAKVATAIGRETRSRGIHQALSPVINIARDVRWGRVEETYGEDPYLTARMGVAFCKNMEQEGVITTPKHYATNVGDGGRDSYPIHFSERLLREIYFPAFKACFQEGNAGSVMAAYNSIDGLPCSASPWLLNDVLRNEWGFKGFVVSDYGSVWGILNHHHTARTKDEAAKQSIEAGLDVEFPGIDFYGDPLIQDVKKSIVSEKIINIAVSRILKAKFEHGLFENPFVDPQKARKINGCKEHRDLALESARQSIVLLKNENNLLPLKKDIKNLAVIGQRAKNVKLGGYSGPGINNVSILDGIKNIVPNANILYSEGCPINQYELSAIPSENLFTIYEKGEINGLKVEYFNNMNLTGEPALVRIDKQINFDWGSGSPDKMIDNDKFSIRWTGDLVPVISGNYKISVTTDDGVRLYIDDKLLVDSWFDRGATSDIINMKLEANKKYHIKIEYYENGGVASAKLGWELSDGKESQEFLSAIDIAKKSDAVVIVAGIIEGEGMDRSVLDLSGLQEKLIKYISEIGKPVIVVLINGSAITMQNWIVNVPSILEAWYPGEEGGNAVAEVLFGDYNPAGRLPITFPLSVGQVPIYYNHKPTGRGDHYVDLSGKPLFPFGYGLSYTNFEFNNLKVIPDRSTLKENVRIEFAVKNIGSRKGDEVVQLYIHDVVGSTIRPVKELKGFRRITLVPGEEKIVTFDLKPDDLALFDKNMKWNIEPGFFEIMIGSSSEDIKLKKELEVIK
jgi:beta-glucosidase